MALASVCVVCFVVLAVFYWEIQYQRVGHGDSAFQVGDYVDYGTLSLVSSQVDGVLFICELRVRCSQVNVT